MWFLQSTIARYGTPQEQKEVFNGMLLDSTEHIVCLFYQATTGLFLHEVIYNAARGEHLCLKRVSNVCQTVQNGLGKYIVQRLKKGIGSLVETHTASSSLVCYVFALVLVVFWYFGGLCFVTQFLQLFGQLLFCFGSLCICYNFGLFCVFFPFYLQRFDHVYVFFFTLLISYLKKRIKIIIKFSHLLLHAFFIHSRSLN